MNLVSERGSVTRSSLVCKATCCGSQSRAPFRRPGSWFQCMRKSERRLSMNLGTSNIEHRMKESPHLIGLRPEASARQAPTLFPPIRVSALTLSLSHQNGRGKRRGNRPSLGSFGPAGSKRPASLARQTGSLRQVQGFNERFYRGNLSPGERVRVRADLFLLCQFLLFPRALLSG